MVPWAVGLLPNAIVIGVVAAHANIPTTAGWLTGPLVFAASAQVTLIELVNAGTAPVLVVVAALAVNVRLVVYSAVMAARWQGTTRRWRAIGAYFIVDPVVAVGVDGYERAPDRAWAHLHYLGAAALLWCSWLAAMAVGAIAGSNIPGALRLEVVVPLFLVGQIVTRLTNRAAKLGVAVAATAAALGTLVPMNLGPLLAMAAGVAVAVRVEGGGR
ncbi:MAG TPA: AzlC family ABC transporter permease [Acidimicrobiales bacterium]